MESPQMITDYMGGGGGGWSGQIITDYMEGGVLVLSPPPLMENVHCFTAFSRGWLPQGVWDQFSWVQFSVLSIPFCMTNHCPLSVNLNFSFKTFTVALILVSFCRTGKSIVIVL